MGEVVRMVCEEFWGQWERRARMLEYERCRRPLKYQLWRKGKYVLTVSQGVRLR